MLTILLTFVVTSLLYIVAICFACRRVCRHLSSLPDNNNAVSVLVEHVLMPLFWQQKGPDLADDDPDLVIGYLETSDPDHEAGMESTKECVERKP